MGQVADVINGLEAKLSDVQKQLDAANADKAALTVQLATAQANALDAADVAAVASGEAIINPVPVAAPVPATPSA